MNKLKPTQEKFIKEYVKDGNATRAIQNTHPTIKSYGAQRVQGHKLLTNTNVQKRIQEVLEDAGLTPELITKELKGLIIGDDLTQKNRAIRTAAEIMGLIGRNNVIANQVNVGNSIPEADKTILEEYNRRVARLRKGEQGTD